MTRRTVLFAAAGVVVVVAAVVTSLMLFTGSEGSADPNETAVTELCRDAAEERPLMTDGRLKDFAVDEMTHETQDGVTFYRARGSVTASDGYGGTDSYRYLCDARLAGEGTRWELINLTVI